MRKGCLIVALCLLAEACAERSDDHWIWRSYSRRERAFRDVDRNAGIRNAHDDANDKYRGELYAREPTTKRPQAGEPENDEIEDYADIDAANKPTPAGVGTRQFNPYGGGGVGGGGGLFNGGQQVGTGGFGGVYPGGNYGGGYGGANPGVLVGPGGPTGIIGRPQQQQFPGAFPGGYGGFNGAQNGGFNGAQNGGFNGIPNGGFNGAQNGVGIGGYPGIYGGGAGIGAGLTGAGYPAQGGGFGNYPGAQTGFGQYPNGAQYPFGQFPGAEYNGNQFQAGGQFPGLGLGQGQGLGQGYLNQYGGQGGPQYTEGYGLASPNGQLGIYGGNNFGVGVGFDENSTKRKAVVAEGKSAKSREVELVPTSTVDDKLNKKV